MRRAAVFFVGIIGDAVVALPALQQVRSVLGAGSWLGLINEQHARYSFSGRDVLAQANIFDDVVSYDATSSALGRVRSTYRIWKFLAQNSAREVVYFAPSVRSKRAIARDRIFFRACGSHQLWGFRHISTCLPGVSEHEGETHLRRLRADGLFRTYDWPPPPRFLRPTPVAAASVRAWLTDRGISPAEKIVILAPGTNQPSKLWPVDRFASLGRRFAATPNVRLIIIGGPAEAEIAESLIRDIGAGISAAGRFTVHESAALLSMSSYYVGLDTGATHLAASVGACGIALYSQKSRVGQWEPLSNMVRVFRSSAVSCSGCESVVCRYEDHACMKNIAVDSVWRSIATNAGFICANEHG